MMMSDGFGDRNEEIQLWSCPDGAKPEPNQRSTRRLTKLSKLEWDKLKTQGTTDFR